MFWVIIPIFIYLVLIHMAANHVLRTQPKLRVRYINALAYAMDQAGKSKGISGSAAVHKLCMAVVMGLFIVAYHAIVY